jgi:peptidyl-dipeptidase Dcp
MVEMTLRKHITVLITASLSLLMWGCSEQTPETTTSVQTAPAETTEALAPEPVTDNPLFQEWQTPFGIPPFDSIKDEHYLPAVDKGIEEQRACPQSIKASKNSVPKSPRYEITRNHRRLKTPLRRWKRLAHFLTA